MPAAAVLGGAAIQGGTSLLGGLLGSSAASRAAKLQQQMAQQQATAFQNVLNQYNPQIASAATAAQQGVTSAAATGGQGAIDAAGQIRTDATSANQLLTPYTDLGAQTADTLRQFMAPGGGGNQTFTAADMAAYDPGYQFRIDQANKALQSSAAASGSTLGGGALKASQKYLQNVASSEFGAASDRFRQQQTDRYNRLMGATQLGGQFANLAGQNILTAGQAGLQAGEYAGTLGFQGASQAGQFGTQAAQQEAQNALQTQKSIADLMTGGAAAQAGGIVGSANAWGGALGGVANAAGGVGRYYQDKDTLAQLMKLPRYSAGGYGSGYYEGG